MLAVQFIHPNFAMLAVQFIHAFTFQRTKSRSSIHSYAFETRTIMRGRLFRYCNSLLTHFSYYLDARLNLDGLYGASVDVRPPVA